MQSKHAERMVGLCLELDLVAQEVKKFEKLWGGVLVGKHLLLRCLAWSLVEHAKLELRHSLPRQSRHSSRNEMEAEELEERGGILLTDSSSSLRRSSLSLGSLTFFMQSGLRPSSAICRSLAAFTLPGPKSSFKKNLDLTP